MGWRLVEVEREDTETNIDLDPIQPTAGHGIDETTIDFPDWYSEHDSKVKMVLMGICNSCSHLRLLFRNDDNYELRGSWCSALRQKLEQKIDNCDAFYAVGDEIEKLVDNQATNHDKTTNES